MCGIFGYVGVPVQVVPMVSAALKTMEYRGYDSWGIGWDNGQLLKSEKAIGRVPAGLESLSLSSLAIGHTRWATHGVVNERNAHPHFDASYQVGVVHNGVIENANLLREGLGTGIILRSETDSEILAHMVSRELAEGASLEEAVKSVFLQLEGNSAIVVARRETGEIVAITSRSPLRLGRGSGGWYLASDPLALTDLCDQIAAIPDNALLRLDKRGVILRSCSGGENLRLEWEYVAPGSNVSLGEHPHFTIKEIHDQPDVLRTLIIQSQDVIPLAEAIKRHSHLILTGCGSAFYAASLGAEWLRQTTGCWIDVLPASELDAHTRNHGNKTLVLALTQSGETADVVDAIHVARSWGASTATLVNTESSTVAKMVDLVVPIHAGIERSVLATKSFLAMITRLLQLTDALLGGKDAGSLDLAAPGIERILDCEVLHRLAYRIQVRDHVLTLGKGVGHKIALEAALKIKEGSYAHAEAFLTGELKHGPLALVTGGTPCMLFATTPQELSGAKIAAQEIMSRGGFTIGIGDFEESDCSTVLKVPDIGIATPLIHLVVAQKFAYHLAIARGVDPDFPRNLAKSVTVR